MDELSSEDYRKLLTAIEHLGAGDDYASFPERTLKAVMTAVEVDFASYSEVDLATGGNRFLLRPDIADLPQGSPAWERMIRRFGSHPILAHRVRARSGTRDAFLDRIRLMGMVGNCCGEAELLLNLEFATSEDRPRLVGIAVNRSIRDFDLRDTARFEALKPHLLAAYRSAARSERLKRGVAPPAAAGAVGGLPLTNRESQVLYWVSMGKTNEEVGTIIGARPMTVKKHLEHVYDKLGVPNRTAAARMVTFQQSNAF